jgi:hypothetical protein
MFHVIFPSEYTFPFWQKHSVKLKEVSALSSLGERRLRVYLRSDREPKAKIKTSKVTQLPIHTGISWVRLNHMCTYMKSFRWRDTPSSQLNDQNTRNHHMTEHRKDSNTSRQFISNRKTSNCPHNYAPRWNTTVTVITHNLFWSKQISKPIYFC